jgi:hypothetical protein
MGGEQLRLDMKAPVYRDLLGLAAAAEPGEHQKQQNKAQYSSHVLTPIFDMIQKSARFVKSNAFQIRENV